MIKRILAIIAALCGLALVAPSGTAFADTNTIEEFPSAACGASDYARPTVNGWHNDPCSQTIAYTRNSSGVAMFRMATMVQFEWSMSGGAHITGARATERITAVNLPAYFVETRGWTLGRTNGYSGVLTQSTSVVNSYPEVYTVGWKHAGVGCGDYNSPIGSGSYGVQMRGYFGWRDYNGAYGYFDFLSAGNGTYYQFSADGSC